MLKPTRSSGLMTIAIATLFSCPARAEPSPQSSESIEAQFQNPPNSARPRVWWHWMNGNVTKDGIVKDLDWMVKVGIGGLQNFDIDLLTPLMVPKRLVYMTPEWKDAFRFAAGQAEKRGLEFAIASSPGWSETGGPWVAAQDGMKKLAWSETEVKGGARFQGKLAPPPDVSGPFQDLPIFDASAAAVGMPQRVTERYSGDIAVFAVKKSAPLPVAKATDGAGKPIDISLATDSSLVTAVDLARSTDAPATVVLDYGKPVTVRSASMFSFGSKAMFTGAAIQPQLEWSEDAKSWKPLGAIAIEAVPTTIGFSPVTARFFRLTLKPAVRGGENLGNPAPGIAPLPFVQKLAEVENAPIKLNDFRLSNEPVVNRFEAKAGFSVESDYYALDTGQHGASTPATIVDLRGRMKPDGTLDWTPPKGQWTIYRLGYSLLGKTNHPAPAEATGLEVDKLDGEAVRGYLQHYIGMYRDAAGSDLMGPKGVRAILTDSIEVGAANWTPKLIAQFKRLRGYDPTPWLPALTGAVVASEEQSNKFLYDYRQTLSDLMASEHYGTVARVAHENGLRVYGEALEGGRPSLGDDMAMRRYADIPMSALWTYPNDGEPRSGHVVDMKGAASVAHIYGQNLVAAESMTSALRYWADSPRTLKHAIDLEFVTGVNRPVIHTSVHSPDEAGEPGLSLMIFGQYFNRHDAWTELAKPWIDYISRNSFMLQQGRNFADVGYFYGEEAPLSGLYSEKPVTDAPTTYAYDFVNAEAVMDAMRNEGDELVTSGGARFKVLYLGGSSGRMTLATLRRLGQLVEGGATIVGLAPQSSPSLSDNPSEWSSLRTRLWPGGASAQVGKGKVIASADVEAALASLGVAPDLRFTGAQPDGALPFVHRRLPDGDSYFIVNRKNRAERVEARFRVSGKAPEIWHADTGRREVVSYRTENGETIVPLSLSAGDSFHVVFRKPATAPSLSVPPAQLQSLATLTGPWVVEFQPGRGAPAKVGMTQLTPLDQSSDPRIKYFSGLATYRTTFAAPNGWRQGRPLSIDLGDVREIAEVRVNGKPVGSAWHAPYRVDLTSAVRPGRNTLEVRVGTLWVNRMIGDAQPGAKAVTKASLPTYQATAPLQPAGLIGPVRLVGSQP
jgi:hypothetical protein